MTKRATTRKPAVRASVGTFAGRWRFIEFHDLDLEVDRTCVLTIKTSKASTDNSLRGEFVFDLCQGVLDGAVRVFGDETIAIFGYDAGWEMDALRGGGWMRLTGDGLIEGEFIGEGDLGLFTAKRIASTK